ncbi:hypothetical protein R84B8_00725 [Treponema sp. R8-4-B8]
MKKTNALKINISLLILILGVIGFSMLACSDGGDDDDVWVPVYGIIGKTAEGNNVIVMDTDTAVSKLKSLSEDGTLVFDNLEGKYIPKEGDIIGSWVSKAAPYGFIYKVKTVTTDGVETVITTEMAALEEAVEKMRVKGAIDLASDVDEGRKVADGVRLVRKYADSDARAGLSSDALTLEYEFEKTIKGVTIQGFFEISATLEYDIDIDERKINRFELSTQPRLRSEITASIGGKIEKEISYDIITMEFFPINIPAPFPIIITPEISIVVVITAEGKAELSAKLVEWDYSYVFGVRYTEGSKLQGFSMNTSQPAKYLENIELTLSGEVKVKPKVEFMFGLYHIGYVGISAGLYSKLAGEAVIGVGGGVQTDANLAFSCGMEFDAEADLRVIFKKLTIAKMDPYTFYNVEWNIWEKNWTTIRSVTANGSASQNTTQLTLTFSKPVPGLSSDNIILSGVSGMMIKGALSGTAPVYTLPISGFNASGTMTVTINKTGYTFIGSPKTVPVYYVPIPVTFNSISANGSASQTTTYLELNFSAVINGLSAEDITLNGGPGGVIKGSLIRTGTNYILPISGIRASGTLSVAVAKTGYTISGSPKTVTIYKSVDLPAAPANVRVVGSTSTSISLMWDQVLGADGYYIYQRNDAGSYQRIGTSYDVGAYIDGLVPKVTGRFKISAFNIAGEGPQSEEVVGKTSDS